jgi:aspartyl-tRNA(Asn)/glutamyl-tRNA(Gln) amidotransferase subunit A
MSGGLAFLGIAEAAELIRAKKLSPVEYTKVLLGQIERHDSKFNAFITVTPERAPDRGARGRG